MNAWDQDGEILIVYDSRTGNTERMAQAVAEGARQIKGTTVNVKKVDETDVSDLPKADAIILVAPLTLERCLAI